MRKWFGLVLLLGGCSWWSDDKGLIVDRGKDYLKAGEGPELVIPEGLSAEHVQSESPVPPIPTPLDPEYFSGQPPRPDAIHGDDSRDQVRIQRLGNRTWLAVPEDPSIVWPKTKQFLADNGVSVVREMPPAGRIDSEWLTIENTSYRDVIRLIIRDGKDKAQLSGGQDRIRLRVEPGLRERTSEVLLRYENDVFSPPGPDDLVDLMDSASHDAEIEQELLNELGAYIAARVAQQTVSMVATEMTAPVKSFIERDTEGDPVLRLLVDSDRAWATIGQSLLRANIEVVEDNESAGLYQINVPKDLEVDESEKGWVRRLFSFGGKGVLALQIRIRQADDGSQFVRAFDAEGAQLDRDFEQAVLVLLREYSS